MALGFSIVNANKPLLVLAVKFIGDDRGPWKHRCYSKYR